MKIFSFKNYGFFEPYTPCADAMEGVLYSRNKETQECWYSAVKKTNGKINYKFLLNSDKRVVGYSPDAEYLFPVDMWLIEILDAEVNTEEFRAMYFDFDLGALYLIKPDGERVYV